MELIRLACPLLRSSPFESVMGWFNFLGDGLVAGGIGVALLACGLVARHRRLSRAGLAAALGVLAAGLIANLLKVTLQLPRPDPGGDFGFPSGHTSTAFALAGALGQAFPAAAPFLHVFAVLAGAARLYVRAHFVRDVLVGGLLGSASGLLLARLLLGPAERDRPPSAVRWGWVPVVVAGLLALGFFALYERSVAAPGPGPMSPPGRARGVVVRFGAPEARPFLLEGWSRDEGGGVWVEGVEARLRLPSLGAVDQRVRLTAQPYVRPGGRSTCQIMDVAVNGVPLARFLVEKGWREYEVRIPKDRLRPGADELGFRLAYAESPAADGVSGDRRFLSVQFNSLETLPDE